jgi:hypothetical protein
MPCCGALGASHSSARSEPLVLHIVEPRPVSPFQFFTRERLNRRALGAVHAVTVTV